MIGLHDPEFPRQYLSSLFIKKGVFEFKDQKSILSMIFAVSLGHAAHILNGTRDLGTRCKNGLNKYAVLAEYFQVSADEIIALENKFKAEREKIIFQKAPCH